MHDYRSQLENMRLMRTHVGAAMGVAIEIEDTLLAALLEDVNLTLSSRIEALIVPVRSLAAI